MSDVSPELPDEVAARLREAGSLELLHLLETYGEALDAAAVRHVLRNPHAGEEVVRGILARPRFLTWYEVRRDLALHPATPQARALQLISGLFWRDLVAVGLEVRLPPPVRRAADLRLVERLPGLAVGEKVAIARRASPTVVQGLRHDPSPRVIAALLENPRLTEATLLPLLAAEGTSPAVLSLVANDRRWGHRGPIRATIARNPATPAATVLPLLPLLPKGELRAVAQDPRLAEPVRRRAALLVGG